MTNQELEQQIAGIVDLNVVKSREPSNLGFMKRNGSMNNNQEPMRESQRILTEAGRVASNENFALYGDQVEYNIAVAQFVGFMNKHRSKAIGDATFSELVRFAYEFMKILKGTVHNSEPYMQAAASLGTAAECASNEDKQ